MPSADAQEFNLIVLLAQVWSKIVRATTDGKLGRCQKHVACFSLILFRKHLVTVVTVGVPSPFSAAKISPFQSVGKDHVICV